MDYVGLLNMGLNQMKRNIRHIPAQRRAYLKIKENTLQITKASTLTTTSGTGAVSKS